MSTYNDYVYLITEYVPGTVFLSFPKNFLLFLSQALWINLVTSCLNVLHSLFPSLCTNVGGDLRRYLKNPSIEISWKLRVQIAADVAKAMAFLHSKKIMHRHV